MPRAARPYPAPTGPAARRRRRVRALTAPFSAIALLAGTALAAAPAAAGGAPAQLNASMSGALTSPTSAPSADVDPIESTVVETSVEAGAAVVTTGFDVAGVRLEEGSDVAAVEVRVRDDEEWSEWTSLEVLTDDSGPDPGTQEYERARPATEPILAAGSSGIEVRLPEGGTATLVLIDGKADQGTTSTTPAPPTTSDATMSARPSQGSTLGSDSGSDKDAYTAPPLVRRAEWGADESQRSCIPQQLNRYKGAVVHHTANSNTYSQAEAAALVRGIYSWHTEGLGWCDVGYQFLVDRFGTIYEGRYGSTLGAVQGAQSGGFNNETFGVAIIGDFTTSAPTEASLAAVNSVIQWQFSLDGVDPTWNTTFTSAGNSKYPAGTLVTLPTVMGHRDNGHTTCPGDQMYTLLDRFRQPLPVTPLCGTGQLFSDVGGTTAFRREICWLSGEGVTTGYTDGTFRPRDLVGRGAMAAFLYRYAGAAAFTPPATSPFSDLTPQSPFYREITWLAQTGITTGYRDGTFRPADPISRGAMAAFLYRYAASPEFTAPELSAFTDVPTTGGFYKEIHWLRGTGITLGYSDGTFRPMDSIQRGAMAAFLFRADVAGLR